MPSVIVENQPHERLSIKHIGIVNQGIDHTHSDAARAWAPAYETHTLKEIDGATDLTIDMNVPPEYREIFANASPKAMEAIKKTSGNSGAVNRQGPPGQLHPPTISQDVASAHYRCPRSSHLRDRSLPAVLCR